MNYIISTVFIAELIILYTVVKFLLETDNKIRSLTQHVDKRRTILKWRYKTVTDITEGINEIFPTVLRKLNKTKNNLIIKYCSELFQFIILIFFKPKYKKLLIGTKTGVNITRKLLKV